MSSISGVDSKSLLNVLLNSLSNSKSSDAAQNTESESTDTQQTTSDSATASINSLDQLKISFLQNQYSFITSLLNSDDSTSADSANSLASVLENAEAGKTNDIIASNPQLAQLFNALNLSLPSSESNDLTTSLLESLDSSSLSQSDLDSIKTAMENLLKSYGTDINSSAQEILNKYLSSSSDKSSVIKTTV
jgi:hypothetical protein